MEAAAGGGAGALCGRRGRPVRCVQQGPAWQIALLAGASPATGSASLPGDWGHGEHQCALCCVRRARCCTTPAWTRKLRRRAQAARRWSNRLLLCRRPRRRRSNPFPWPSGTVTRCPKPCSRWGTSSISGTPGSSCSPTWRATGGGGREPTATRARRSSRTLHPLWSASSSLAGSSLWRVAARRKRTTSRCWTCVWQRAKSQATAGQQAVGMRQPRPRAGRVHGHVASASRARERTERA